MLIRLDYNSNGFIITIDLQSPEEFTKRGLKNIEDLRTIIHFINSLSCSNIAECSEVLDLIESRSVEEKFKNVPIIIKQSKTYCDKDDKILFLKFLLELGSKIYPTAELDPIVIDVLEFYCRNLDLVHIFEQGSEDWKNLEDVINKFGCESVIHCKMPSHWESQETERTFPTLSKI